MDIATINPIALPSLPIEERRALPNCPAIYFVVSAGDEVLYVGKAIRLADRWKTHHRYHQFAAIASAKVAWLVLIGATTELLDSIERACIDHFIPVLNGTSVPIETPTLPETGRIVPHFRQARLAYQVKEGRPVSIQEVARIVGVTRAQLNNIELGKAWPNRNVLTALCALYGAQPGDLLSYEEWLARLVATGSNDTTNRTDAEASEMTPIIAPVPALL